MKKWIIGLAASTIISTLGLAFFIGVIMQNGCIDSGGQWLGPMHGCDINNSYSLQSIASPLGVAIFLGIILGISSALIQMHTLTLKFFNAGT